MEARLEKSLGKGKPLDFCVFMERGYDPTISANTLFDGLLALPESVVPWSTLLPTPKVRLPPGGGGKGEKETNTGQTRDCAQP